MTQELKSGSDKALGFSPERPILSQVADELGRAPFAESIAAAIKGWTGKDSLVLALYGDWGTGKTSLKNLIVESLRFDKERSPYIVDFNPWQWAGQEQVSQAFFREIGYELGRKDSGEEAKASAKRWRRYGEFLGLGAEIFAGTRRIALVVLAIIAFLGVVGIVGAFLDVWIVRVACGVVVALSIVLIALLRSGSGIAKTAAKYFSTVAEIEEKSLEETKAQLSGALARLRRPMLVVVDDVDRLTGPEMMLLFQLLKANADFPNMVYLTLFQREVVEEAITKELSGDGREYLKKIVQVGFDVPNVERSKLERVLLTRLDAVIDNEAALKLWDSERWANTFISGLRPYFKTLRDVYRFLSTLSLQFSVFAHGDAFEVNPIDLISLEVLRVFEPAVFKALPGAKSTLTGVNRGSFRSQQESAQKSELEALVQKAGDHTRENVRAIIKTVFPPTAWALGGSYYEHQSDRWFREHRACHPDLFDKYFQMTIPEGDISLRELEEVVSLASDRAALADELRSLGKRKLLDVTMDRLEAYKEAIGLEHAVPFITGLFDIGDDLPPGHLGISEVPAAMHATRIIYFYLKQEPTLATRGEVLTKCVNDTTGIYLPVYVIAIEGDKVKENREEQARLIDEEGLKQLKDTCANRIAQAAAEGTLLHHPNLAELLGSWQKWTSSEEPREWVRSLIDTPKGLLLFLLMCMRETRSQSLGSYTVRSKWQMDLQSVERFVPVDVVEIKVARLSTQDLSVKEKETVEAFHEAIKRKKEGKTSFSPIEDI